MWPRLLTAKMPNFSVVRENYVSAEMEVIILSDIRDNFATPSTLTVLVIRVWRKDNKIHYKDQGLAMFVLLCEINGLILPIYAFIICSQSYTCLLNDLVQLPWPFVNRKMRAETSEECQQYVSAKYSSGDKNRVFTLSSDFLSSEGYNNNVKTAFIISWG